MNVAPNKEMAEAEIKKIEGYFYYEDHQLRKRGEYEKASRNVLRRKGILLNFIILILGYLIYSGDVVFLLFMIPGCAVVGYEYFRARSTCKKLKQLSDEIAKRGQF